jgi:hypothetical protein
MGTKFILVIGGWFCKLANVTIGVGAVRNYSILIPKVGECD